MHKFLYRYCYVVNLIVILGVFAPHAALGNYNSGVNAYKVRDYTEARQVWEPLAKAGHPRAQYGMGLIYRYARGVDGDVEIARQWFLLSANQGYAKARLALGNLYLKNPKAAGDVRKGLRLIAQAAKAGLAEAQYEVGILYLEGRDVPKNEFRSLQFFTLAANQGYEPAVGYKLRLSKSQAQNLDPDLGGGTISLTAPGQTAQCLNLKGVVSSNRSSVSTKSRLFDKCMKSPDGQTACNNYFKVLQKAYTAYQTAVDAFEQDCQ